MAQHNDRLALPFFGNERPPKRRFHPEHVQVVGSHIAALESFRLANPRQVHRYPVRDRSGKLREALALLAIVQKIRRRDSLFFVVTPPPPEHTQPRGPGKRQGPHQPGVNDAEDPRVRAAPRVGRENPTRREAFVLEQYSQAEPQVLKHLVLQSPWL